MAVTPQPHSPPADAPDEKKSVRELLLLVVTDWLEGDRKHADEIAELVRRMRADEPKPSP